MKSYVDWQSSQEIKENSFLRDLGRGFSNLNRGFRGEQPIDYNAMDQHAQASAQAAAQRDDPNVRKSKYNILKKAFLKDFFSTVPLKGPYRNRAQQSLDNLAKSMTLGYKIHARDLDELLLAIHTSPDVDEMLKSHTFSDHYRLLMYVKQIFDHEPSVWYNPDARSQEERFPPGTVMNSDEMNTYLDHWRKSPFRYRRTPPVDPNATAGPSPTGQAGGGIPPMSNGSELVDWMLKTFTINTGMQKGKSVMPYSVVNIPLHDWKAIAEAIAKSAGITLTPDDYAKLRALA